MLSDLEIRDALMRGTIKVDPIDDYDKRIQPASIDVRLGAEVLLFMHRSVEEIDPKADPGEAFEPYRIGDAGLLIYPDDFYLGTTIERVTLDASHAARVEGKSSLGRLGLCVHATAGFVDPGFDGQVTLEIFNTLSVPIRLYAGMPIAQLAFDRLDSRADIAYRGKYQDQVGPQASRYWQNWDAEAASW